MRAVNSLGGGPYSDPSASFTTAAGVPAAPTGVTVTRNGLLYTVAFSPPTSDGGSPISFYVASCASTTGGKNRSGAAATSPIDITGLTAGQTYECRVHAANADGNGPYSTQSTRFTA